MLIIIGMALVTMIPRVLPAFVIGKWVYPRWVSRWLNAIPYAALGALIFPWITTVIEGKPLIGILGGIVAVVLAVIKVNTIIVVLGAILSVFVMNSVF